MFLVLIQFETAWSQTKTLVTFGDSITAGILVPNGAPYAQQLASHFGMRLENRAISGWSSCMMAADQVFSQPVPSKARGNDFSTMMIGTNDSNFQGRGSYKNIFKMCLAASLTWLAIPESSKALVNTGSCAKSGNWKPDPKAPYAGLVSTTVGDNVTCKLKTYGAPIIVWFEVNDDSNSEITVTLNGDQKIVRSIRAKEPLELSYRRRNAKMEAKRTGASFVVFNNVQPGQHEVKIQINGYWTTQTGSVKIYGIGTPPQINNSPRIYVGGVPYQKNDLRAPDTYEYFDLARSIVSDLRRLNMPITFVNTRQYLLGAVSEYVNDDLHPNTLGHTHLFEAFAKEISQ